MYVKLKLNRKRTNIFLPKIHKHIHVCRMYHVSIRLTLVIHVMNNYIVVGQTTLF